MAASWNAAGLPKGDAGSLQNCLPPPRHFVFRNFLQVAVLTALAAALASYQSASILRSSHASSFGYTSVLVLWLAAVFGVRRIAELLTTWRSSAQASSLQKNLTSLQRGLLGIPAAQPALTSSGVPMRKPLAAPAPALPTPIATPQRTTPAAPSSFNADGLTDYTVRTPLTDYSARTPLTGGSAGMPRPSPKSPYSATDAVATPGKLQHYLDAFERDVLSPPKAPSSDAAAGAQQQQTPPSHFARNGGDADVTASVGLALGQDAPKYRPSWVAKKGVTAKADVPLSPSSEEEIADFCSAVLKIKPQALEVWTERLREWLAGHLLQPLVRAVDKAHVHVNEILQQYGYPAAGQLPPLPSIVSASGAQANATDIEAMLHHLQAWCQQQLYQHNTQRGLDALQLNKYLQRYEQLLLLLRGRRPADLLPPTPAAYIWSRLLALADGTCLLEFRWNGGGSWAGRPWQSDLPNDGALLLYMFAAFLDAPGWELPSRGAGNDADCARGMPLYLGQLKPRPANQYTAILSYRPDTKPGKDVDALLSLSEQGTGTPMVCVVADGRMLALTGHNGMFHAILMMLQFHKLRYRGLIGEAYLSDQVLSLAPVIEPPALGSAVAALRHVIFGVFFPPHSHDA